MSEAPTINAGIKLTGTKAAKRYVELLTGDAGAPMRWRLIDDNKDRHAPPIVLYGRLADQIPEIKARQAEGYGTFAVVNEGGNSGEEITKVRALFIDEDKKPLPATWHVHPDFIVQRDATHWHAYWLVNDCPLDKFTECQKRLIAYYKSDDRIHDLPRIMRIPGTLHQKVGH